MFHYLIRRLILLPITLFFIILINFIIINLAPGDPVTIKDISSEGAARSDRSIAFGSDDRYLQFREFYGLTLPVLFNTWPWLREEYVRNSLEELITKKDIKGNLIDQKKYEELRIRLGDQARYIMPLLLTIIESPNESMAIRQMASRFFVRGGTKQAFLGANLNDRQKNFNKKIAVENSLLANLLLSKNDSKDQIEQKVAQLKKWYQENKEFYHFTLTPMQKVKTFFFETRFFRYFSRVLLLDFGTLRNDNNKTVISEVSKRFKYSLTLSILPLLITLVLCQIAGFAMAIYQNKWPDYILNASFLILYAIPVFVVAPFLIQIAINKVFPFTNEPIPISGFTSSDAIYSKENSFQRLMDIVKHIALPLIAIIYGTLAAQSRLSRTAVLEVLRQDYVRTAWAKGATPMQVFGKHVGRNASITIVTSIAGSLGVVLGGALIVETLFEINGFGRFFYEAVLDRDYNVIMFSTLAGSFLTLMGYLIADIAYTLLDPRVTLE
ncbi:Dipeptide transport system permease protein DppB [Candidatus Rubidus massiliensis]|nr:Dipeptide transport system permease protein DppB [Candidatus Rubidus massiliensis]